MTVVTVMMKIIYLMWVKVLQMMRYEMKAFKVNLVSIVLFVVLLDLPVNELEKIDWGSFGISFVISRSSG